METRNRRFNFRKRQKPETLEALENEISANKAMLERMTAISLLRGHEGWEALKKTKAEELDAVESELDGFESLTDKGRDYALARRKEIKRLLSMVDDSALLADSIQEDINNFTMDLNERKKRIREIPV